MSNKLAISLTRRSSVILTLAVTALIRFAFWTLFNHFVSEPYMDEIFHVPQAQRIFRGDFTYDPAITTFPGLYWATAIIARAVESIDNAIAPSLMRGVNCFVFAVIADLSILSINDNLKTFLAISYIPNFFFYNFLFYTDSASTALVLASLALHQKGHVIWGGLSGLCAVAVRQTNIVWVFVIAAGNLWDDFENCRKPFLDFFIDAAWKFQIQILTGIAFLIFFIKNDFSVVLGHKEYHKNSMHLAQIDYFLLLLFFLSGPKEWLKTFVKTYQSIADIQSIRKFITFFCIFFCFAKFGTVAHIFVLSDNRHLTFYLWRWFLCKDWIRLFLVPMTSAAVVCFSNCTSLQGLRLSKSQMMNGALFWFCTVLTLVPSPLFEIRYLNTSIILALLNGVADWKWNCVLSAALIYVFLAMPFLNPQSGIIERFIL